MKWFISTFLRQFDAQMEFGIRKKRKQKTAPAVTNVPAAQPEQSQKPSEESHAAAFYEQASETREDSLEAALFDAGSLSLQDELDNIVAGIASPEDLLPAKEEDDA